MLVVELLVVIMLYTISMGGLSTKNVNLNLLLSVVKKYKNYPDPAFISMLIDFVITPEDKFLQTSFSSFQLLSFQLHKNVSVINLLICKSLSSW
jgi:hypothetical protein